MTARASLSVVVPTRDRPDHLRVALAAIAAAVGPSDEVIVVDSASADPDGVARVAAAAGARLVRLEHTGAAAARNAGWRLACNSYVGFVDDDVVVDPGWADAMVAAYDEAPDAAFVTGRLDAGDTDTTMTVAIRVGEEAEVITAGTGGVIGHSANLSVRRSVLSEIAGFDPSLGAGARWRAAEDTDLFDRILATGRTGYYAPAARGTHTQWRRIRAWVRLQHSYGVGSGARLAKLWRKDRTRWRVIVRDDVWVWGFAQLPGEVRRRDGYRALGTLLRLAGIVRGFAGAAVTPIENGQFRAASKVS